MLRTVPTSQVIERDLVTCDGFQNPVQARGFSEASAHVNSTPLFPPVATLHLLQEMAEVALGLVGAAATMGAAGLTRGSGFTGRHESSHREEILETRRNTDSFLASLQKGGVTPDEEGEFLEARDEAFRRGEEYYDSIESYKDVSWLNLPDKLKKKKEVRRKKRLTQQSNNSLRSLNESVHWGSDTSSISAQSGSPPGSNLAADDIQEWADEVQVSGASNIQDAAEDSPDVDPQILEVLSSKDKIYVLKNVQDAAEDSPDVDPQIIEALSSKNRIYVLKLGELMEALISDHTRARQRIDLSPATTYQRMLVYRCSSFYGLSPEIDSVTKAISVVITEESRMQALPLRRRIRCRGLSGQRRSANTRKNRRTIEERMAAYSEARNRIFLDLEEKERWDTLRQCAMW
ncbi:hypothetical protein DFH08DRAFT_815111 [Mycena albidolilacea]|uniref:R3H domain-containing protein n=1 Tax=Mycena albidolilacea TaxID=1033008 RepID=A0AAD6ZNR1_9AGAR|nr:hypothetical protein DFH08DRAFT_815111 [Mycena albidolilacea]